MLKDAGIPLPSEAAMKKSFTIHDTSGAGTGLQIL